MTLKVQSLRPLSPADLKAGTFPFRSPAPDLLPLFAPFFRSPWTLFLLPGSPFRSAACVHSSRVLVPFPGLFTVARVSSSPGALLSSPAGTPDSGNPARSPSAPILPRYGVPVRAFPWVVSEPGMNGPASR
uniref:uncharacterized protein LOC105758374 n=1 Tax=Odobenus rosmarus divergens TaxID=9708 RepID=UPI00063C2CB7|nr:PREDICTED: uncharacterized protein LOC105758374 [Odobenus rosmarus divergens]